jgi:hypothetical protein
VGITQDASTKVPRMLWAPPAMVVWLEDEEEEEDWELGLRAGSGLAGLCANTSAAARGRVKAIFFIILKTSMGFAANGVRKSNRDAVCASALSHCV